MNQNMKQLIQTMQDAVKAQAQKSEATAYDTPATVRRIEGDTAWVHINGGVDETPVKLTIAAKVGDDVQVRVSGGRAFMVGNASAPPTDDTTAIIAQTTANYAVEDSARAKEAADNAEASAVAAREAATQAVTDAGIAGRAASVAQTAAEAALEIARMVFLSEPEPPYRVGDLWVKFNEDDYSAEDDDGNNLVDSQGNIFEYIILGGSDVYTCTTPRLEGDTFHEEDWVVAATDNTQLNEMREWFWHDANGAHVLGDASGYRNDISSTGMRIMDASTETAVAEFGEDIVFAGDRTATIGNNNAYIVFDPASGGSITIGGGSRVNIGSGKTLDEVLTDIDVSVTQTAGGADITVNGDTVSISNGQNGAPGDDGTTFTPSVDSAGNISWTNDGGKQNPQTQNIKGPQGAQGIQGIQGEQGIQGIQGDTGPEAIVTISISSVNWTAGTATLSATLRVNGTITSPTTYKWTKNTNTTSLGTSATLSISDLDAVYNCTVTW